MEINALLFDLDGTLVHTHPAFRYLIVGLTLRKFGKSAQQPTIDKFWFESGRDELINEEFGLEPRQFWREYNTHDTAELRSQFARPYDDVGFVREMKIRGYKTGIVTGAPLHIADLEIGMLGRQNFDAVVVAHVLNGMKPKPHPHGIEECLSLLDVPARNAIYVGNADEDIETARNAEVYDVLIDREEHTFSGLNPSLAIKSLYELIDKLNLKHK